MKGASPETCEILPSAPKTKTWFVYQRDDAALIAAGSALSWTRFSRVNGAPVLRGSAWLSKCGVVP